MSSKDFKILSKLGAGSFGTTFKAQHKITKEIYCLKRINVSSSDNSKSAEAEIAILSSLPSSPNVVKYFSCYKHSDYVDIIMSYANAGSLDTFTIENRSSATTGLPYDDVVHISLLVSQGIKFLHSNSIMHRDINPRNILIHQKSTNTEVWICDFGISKLVNKEPVATSMVGSHYYVAPEVLSRAPYTNVCDLFSLGVVICFICTGTVPFASPMDWMMGSFDPLTGAYAKLNELVKNLIVSHPNSRWSIDQVIDFLESLLPKPQCSSDSGELGKRVFKLLNKWDRMGSVFASMPTTGVVDNVLHNTGIGFIPGLIAWDLLVSGLASFFSSNRQNTPAVIAEPKPQQLIPVKIVFLTSQSGGNGASTLAYRIERDEFLPTSEPTIGVEFFSVKIPPFNLQLWDTGDLFTYQSIISTYLKGAYIAVLCFRLYAGPNAVSLLEEGLTFIRNTHKGVLLLVLTIIDVTDSYPPVDNCEGFDQLLQQFLVTSVFKVSSKTNEGVPEFKQSLLQYCEALKDTLQQLDEQEKESS
ncbi:hypothetical protein RCL1_006936 [Eukaryota sp. TZLM3-RCL]